MKTYMLYAILMLLATWTARAQETTQVQAAIPPTMSLQGQFTGDNGEPMPDDSYTLTVRIYTTPTGGTALWEEEHVISLSGGIFNVLLGTTTALSSLAFDQPYFLGISLDGAAEMQPRTALSASPYALRAHRLDPGAILQGDNVTITQQASGALMISASGPGSGLSSVASDETLTGNGTAGSPLRLADDSVTDEKLSAKSVTGAKLADGALVGGQNVTITRDANNNLIVEAAGGGIDVVNRDATLTGNGTAGSPLGLADNSVTGPKLVDGALVGGQNVTITRDANNNLVVDATDSGLATVASDATLTGDGTPGNPLSIEAPLELTNNNFKGWLAHNEVGVRGENSNNGIWGYLGGLSAGVGGYDANGTRGLLAFSGYGVYGTSNNGNWGYLGGSTWGGYAMHDSGNDAVLGTQSEGVAGRNANGNYGLLGNDNWGVFGQHSNGNRGYLGGNFNGWAGYAVHNSGNDAVLGTSAEGIVGRNTNGNFGLLGHSNWGVFGQGAPWAGYFQGGVHVTGALSKGGGSFKIDHPLDPANKYLYHSFVESPDMMNVYNGNVTTDERGFATVVLPDYFQALNRDYRYQLTVIGTFAQAIVAKEIQNGRFRIQTNQPGVKVSWQVTGIRQDAWAKENRIPVEENKPVKERGYYLHPTLYGQPVQRSVAWAHNPEGMRALQTQRATLEADRRQIEADRQRIDEARRQAAQASEQHRGNQ